LAACLSCAARPDAGRVTPPAQPSSFTLTVTGDIFRGGASLGFVPAVSFESGDAFRLTIRSTQRVQVYVAYCDTDQKLQTYPASGAVYALPDSELHAPESGNFVVDRKLGRETLYVVASTSALGVTDPALARKLSATVGQAEGRSCAPELEMTTDESRASAGLEPVAVEQPTAPAPRVASGSSASAGPGKHAHSTSRRTDIPEDWRPRGIGVTSSSTVARSVESDASGVAILAFRKEHAR